MSICSGTRTDGRPCSSRAARGADYCLWHDPHRAADRWVARARTRTALASRTLEACTFAEAHSDQLTPDQRRALSEAAAAAQAELDEVAYVVSRHTRDLIRGD